MSNQQRPTAVQPAIPRPRSSHAHVTASAATASPATASAAGLATSTALQKAAGPESPASASAVPSAPHSLSRLAALSASAHSLPGDVAVASARVSALSAEAAPWRESATEKVPALSASGLKKSYRKGRNEVPVLNDVQLDVAEGEFLAIVGQSGSGKSTLLHLLGTLDAPDAGQVQFRGRRIDNLPVSARDQLRNRDFGMVFQFYHLLPELTALENVLAPLMIAEGAWNYFRHRREHRAVATRLLETVKLGHRLHHRPRELSGGEMQRAAIARALVAQPKVLLADEPTGNLDHATGSEILEILRSLNQQQGLTIVMVTHDAGIARMSDRTLKLVAGRMETAG